MTRLFNLNVFGCTLQFAEEICNLNNISDKDMVHAIFMEYQQDIEKNLIGLTIKYPDIKRIPLLTIHSANPIPLVTVKSLIFKHELEKHYVIDQEQWEDVLKSFVLSYQLSKHKYPTNNPLDNNGHVGLYEWLTLSNGILKDINSKAKPSIII